MEDTLTSFATHHHLRIRRDGSADPIIAGRRTTDTEDGDRDRLEYRNHIFDFGDGRLGVCLMFPTRMRWTYAKARLITAGFVLRQNGDTEGTLLFDAGNAEQARLAIRITEARPKRELSPAQRAARLTALEKARTAKAALRIA